MDSREFYDAFADRQVRVGVNRRHHAILAWAERFGLRAGQRVLEIGSGIGTVTGLLARAIGPSGTLVGVELSPRSVEIGRKRLAGHAHVDLMAADILEVPLEGPFDAIVLPDVLEHIPLEHHPRLFERIASWLDPDGFVLLHYPDPHFLEWCHVVDPGGLQLIDQPIHADVLTANVYPHGLHLHFLETYGIWAEEGDYQVAVLKRRKEPLSFTLIPDPPPTLLRRARAKLRLLLAKGRGEDSGA